MPYVPRKPFSDILDAERETILAAYASGKGTKDSAALCGYPPQACAWVLKNAGIKARPPGAARKYAVDETFFDVIDTEEKAYWLGFILADGWITRSKDGRLTGFGVCLASKDVGHLEKLKKSLSSEHPIYHEVNNKPSPSSLVQKQHHTDKVQISSQKLAWRLGERGIVPAKSLIAKPYLDFSEELYGHFWRGAVDGDGCVFRQGISWGISFIGSEAVVSAYRDFLLANGVKTSASVRPEGSIFGFRVAGSRVSKQVAELLWKDATLYLDRKQKLYEELMAAPIQLRDFSYLTAEKLNALFEVHGSWRSVAAALGTFSRHVYDMRKKLGMPIGPCSKEITTEFKVGLTDEKLTELHTKHGCTWQGVADHLGILLEALRQIRRAKGL